MGPTTYALCHKGLIGPVMWLAGLCVFPPLIPNISLPLGHAGTAVTQPFFVPVDKKYLWTLNFEFTSVEARLDDKIVGSNFDSRCLSAPESLNSRSEFGRPIPIRIVVRRANDRTVVVDTAFQSLCIHGHVDNKKSRAVGWVELTRGEYIAEITNVVAQRDLSGVVTTVSLVPGGAK